MFDNLNFFDLILQNYLTGPATKVADLNITSTDLRGQLNLLRQKSLSLSEQLSILEQEVIIKKEERERRGSKNMAQVQTELIKLKRELEVSSQM